jgi:hypothetical protein
MSSNYSSRAEGTLKEASERVAVPATLKTLSKLSIEKTARQSQLLSSRQVTAVGNNGPDTRVQFRGNSRTSSSIIFDKVARNLRLILEYVGRALVCMFFVWYAYLIIVPAIEVVLENLWLIEDNDDDDISAVSEMVSMIQLQLQLQLHTCSPYCHCNPYTPRAQQHAMHDAYNQCSIRLMHRW